MAGWRECLENGDASGLMRLWKHFAPGMPQPASIGEATQAMHYARTACAALKPKDRVYSHEWLEERGLPSALPAELLPERPVAVGGVGIAVKSSSYPALAVAVQSAMSDAVLEMYEDGITEPVAVKAHMMRAREKTRRLG